MQTLKTNKSSRVGSRAKKDEGLNCPKIIIEMIWFFCPCWKLSGPVISYTSKFNCCRTNFLNFSPNWQNNLVKIVDIYYITNSIDRNIYSFWKFGLLRNIDLRPPHTPSKVSNRLLQNGRLPLLSIVT